MVAAPAAVAATAAATGLLGAPGAGASSHLEAPLIANFSPFQEPNGGPNSYPWATDARYDTDSDGDARADLTYRFTFRDDDRRGGSTRLVQKGKVGPSDTGPTSMPDCTALRDRAIARIQGGAKAYVGQGTLRGFNTDTIALQVPKAWLALKGDAGRNPVIGVWADTERRSMEPTPGRYRAHGDWVQVSGLGNPLVNEVEAIYRVPAPKGRRDDLVEIFLTGTTTELGGPIKADLNSQVLNADVDKREFAPSEQLRLNMSVPPASEPNLLGVLVKDDQGFPNGRR